MAKIKSLYICSSCGAQSPKWIGKCPSCSSWNTYVEEVINLPSANRNAGSWKQNSEKTLHSKPQLIQEIKSGSFSRMTTLDPEFNRVVGGGIVPGGVVLIGGQPGIGKSTLLLQVALGLNEKVLYVSGEESEEQIKLRADRIQEDKGGTCYIYSATEISTIIRQAQELRPSVIILDSIQTMYMDWLDSSAGSITQIRESAAEMQRFAKEHNIAVVIIGHITKDGDIAGPKLLEHIVDTVLYFEGDRHHAYRLLRCRKNRFGSADEIGVYEMVEHGLRPVTNPSEALINKRQEQYSGNAIGVIGEGARNFLLEVQALVSRAVYGTPQRSATGYDVRRMNMLLAVLEKKCTLPLGFNDVFLNIAGGFRVEDPSIDLSLAMAIISSLENKIIPMSYCFIGEIGLSGEVRPTQKIDQKLMEAERFGIQHAFISNYNQTNFKSNSLQINPIHKVEELLTLVD